MDKNDPGTRIQQLPLWQGELTIKPLDGGRTNDNYLVSDSSGAYVVRFGDDIPEHHVLRFNELAASRAAHAAGLSPAVVHAQKGLSVIEFIESKTLDEPDLRDPDMLKRAIALVQSCHRDIPAHFRGPALVFWVFHVIRDYAATLRDGDSPHVPLLDEFLRLAADLEKATGPFEMVFGHNDLMAANFLDDGNRLWLIDWDYAGFNSPLFDLGGLASNNQFSQSDELRMLELYFERPAGPELIHRYQAMKCASLMRETMWSMVSEITSDLDIDYAAYTAENLNRFQRAHEAYLQT